MRCYFYKLNEFPYPAQLLEEIRQVLPVKQLQVSGKEIYVQFDNYLTAAELAQLDAIVKDKEQYLSPFDGQWK